MNAAQATPANASTATHLDPQQQIDAQRQTIEALSKSLFACLAQLEGWVAWKCPAQHRAEHRKFIDEQLAVLKAARGRA